MFPIYLYTLSQPLCREDIYWPLLKDHIDAFVALHDITRSWYTATVWAIFFIKMLAMELYKKKVTKLEQWWHKTAIPLGNTGFY